MRPLFLKATATAMTLASAMLSAVYVTSHVRVATAALHPAVIAPDSAAALTVTSRVKSASVQPVTSTYAS